MSSHMLTDICAVSLALLWAGWKAFCWMYIGVKGKEFLDRRRQRREEDDRLIRGLADDIREMVSRKGTGK